MTNSIDIQAAVAATTFQGLKRKATKAMRSGDFEEAQRLMAELQELQLEMGDLQPGDVRVEDEIASVIEDNCPLAFRAVFDSETSSRWTVDCHDTDIYSNMIKENTELNDPTMIIEVSTMIMELEYAERLGRALPDLSELGSVIYDSSKGVSIRSRTTSRVTPSGYEIVLDGEVEEYIAYGKTSDFCRQHGVSFYSAENPTGASATIELAKALKDGEIEGLEGASFRSVDGDGNVIKVY